jgi:hypothetical protein
MSCEPEGVTKPNPITSRDLFLTRFAEYKIGGFSNLTKLIAVAPAIAGFTMLTFSLSTGAAPARAFEARTGQLRIVKDCAGFTGVAGSSTCKIVSSNLDEIPAGSLIYYDQPTGGPAIGMGVLDSNIFVYVKAGFSQMLPAFSCPATSAST